MSDRHNGSPGEEGTPRERAPYLTLGLEPGAPSEEIRRAYRNLSLRLHPDASRDPGTARRFAMVSRAYERLATVKASEGQRREALAPPDTADLFSLGETLVGATDPAERRRAAVRLGLSGKRSAWVFLRKGLYDAEPEVVASCVRAAAVLGLAQGGPELAGAYERAGHRLRDDILEAARATRDAIFAVTLEAATGDYDARRRALACELLRDMGTPSGERSRIGPIASA